MYIDVNNIKIHYEVMGKGKPIILLNPNSVNTNSMGFISKKLAKDFMVYKFDRRCCGKSSRNCDLTYELSALDVYEFIQALKLDKPFLLGCSGGATVALNVAINYPDCISKLICCSGVARKNIVKPPWYTNLLEIIPCYPGKKNNDMFERLNNNMKSLTKQELEKIPVPTLVVNGGKKDIVPIDEAQYISSAINKSKLLILENEGHFSYMINCKWYNRLLDFLNTSGGI